MPRKYLAGIAAFDTPPQLLDSGPQGLPSQDPQQLPGSQLLVVVRVYGRQHAQQQLDCAVNPITWEQSTVRHTAD